MAYKLSELKKQVPGVAGREKGKPATPHSPAVAKRLQRRLDENEDFLMEEDPASRVSRTGRRRAR